ncbi:MAG: hypothetical protein V1886_02800 [archaeon]
MKSFKWKEAEKTLKQFREMIALVKNYCPLKLRIEKQDFPYDILKI